MKLVRNSILAVALLFSASAYSAIDITIPDEVIDQSAHFAIGFIPVAVMGPVAIPFIAAAVAMREHQQHPDGEYGEGAIRDMIFYGAGMTMGVIVH